MFNEEGLEPPQSIIDSTNKYRKNSDKIGNFIEDCLVPSETNLAAKDVYEVYEEWCKSCGYGIEGQRNFYSELKTKNIHKESGTVNGITIRNIVHGHSFNLQWG